jgi:hypothetical protein
MIGWTSNQRFLTVLIVFQQYTGSLIIVPILPGLVVLPDLAIPRPNKKDACTYDI